MFAELFMLFTLHRLKKSRLKQEVTLQMEMKLLCNHIVAGSSPAQHCCRPTVVQHRLEVCSHLGGAIEY